MDPTPTPTLLQHKTDTVFNHLITVNYPKSTGSSTVQPQQLDYKEKTALRYVAGYVTRTIYRRIKDSNHPIKDELLLCLSELNEVDPSEMEDESKDWMEEVDRGGLKNVSNTMYMMFTSAKLELRKYIVEQTQTLASAELHLTKMKQEIIMNDDVQFYWSHQTDKRMQPRSYWTWWLTCTGSLHCILMAGAMQRQEEVGAKVQGCTQTVDFFFL